MRRGRTLAATSVVVAAAAAALMVSTVGAAHGRGAAITPAPAFTADDLTANPAQNWITTGGNAYNQRYSSLDAIKTSNVKRLKVAWMTHLDGSASSKKY